MKITWDERALKRMAEEAARTAMEVARKAASQVHCFDHGESVHVIDRDPRTGGFRLQACCEPAKMAALESIKRALN